MRLDRIPISVLKTRFVPGGWDLLAFVLVFAFLVYVAEAAHGLAAGQLDAVAEVVAVKFVRRQGRRVLARLDLAEVT